MKYNKKGFMRERIHKRIGDNVFIKDNKGSSLLMILALFVVLLAVVVNLMMLVSAGDGTTKQEYEAAQTELYLQSVYEVLNEQMIAGTWEDAFVQDETTCIEIAGFVDGNGNSIPVVIEVTLDGKKAQVQYQISYQGKQYGIDAEYEYHENDGNAEIELKACESVTQL